MLMDAVFKMKDVIVQWEASNSGVDNGVRIQDGNIVGIYRCDYNGSIIDDVIDVVHIRLDLYNEEHLDLMDYIRHKLEDTEKFNIAEPVCDMFKCDDLVLLQTRGDGTPRTNYVDLTRLHYVNGDYPYSWSEVGKLLKCIKDSVSLAFFVGDTNPDNCRTGMVFKITDNMCDIVVLYANENGNIISSKEVDAFHGTLLMTAGKALSFIEEYLQFGGKEEGLFVAFVIQVSDSERERKGADVIAQLKQMCLDSK